MGFLCPWGNRYESRKVKMDDVKRAQFEMLRRRFQLDWCEKCENAGILRVQIEDVGTLAICDCKQGDMQGWNLPRLKTLGSVKHSPLPKNEFHPGVQRQSQEKDSFKFVHEKAAFLREKIMIAERLWAEKDKSGEG